MDLFFCSAGACLRQISNYLIKQIVMLKRKKVTLNIIHPAVCQCGISFCLFNRIPENVKAVIHTHSPYSILWSFVPDLNETDCIPDHTPYLKMKLGTVGLIPYEKPGTPELFAAFRGRAAASDGYLLKAHGPVVPGKSVMDAFYCLEEPEESAHIAWELHRAGYR